MRAKAPKARNAINPNREVGNKKNKTNTRAGITFRLNRKESSRQTKHDIGPADLQLFSTSNHDLTVMAI
jgi:hypothetical protein